ncbi:AAA family ATPase [Actinoplanes sp. GCM10030250]|uniref:AAA family ATPase n=1 Tax=Actinoplanes sp. GCM10030250 TaxID=3273376 RepID=UPI00361E3DB1
MLTRHAADLSVRFGGVDEAPDPQMIEDPWADPIAAEDPDLIPVDREPYVAGPDLENAVNLAIALGRPLLLQGDPGAGKTRLAHAVAYALGLPLEQAYIKSTSRGQDLLYTFDAVRRLYDVQLDRARDDSVYVRLGPLGRAIVRAGYGRRSVVLIDEIDKADIDFPNDLLRELDQLSFEIAELPGARYAVPAGQVTLRPIIIVTNNEEKALPSAFLRRCIFHYVRFPDSPGDLDTILGLHGIAKGELSDNAVAMLLRLRELDLAKKPGLSELLDWIGYLQATDTPADEIVRLPAAGALIKQHTDQLRVADWLAGR